MLNKQSLDSTPTTPQHFIDSGDTVLQQAGESLSKVGGAIANGLSTALKFGLGAVTQPKAFKAYTEEVISTTAAQIQEQLEQGKLVLEGGISKMKATIAETHEYAKGQGKEHLKSITETAQTQLREGLEYLKLEAIDFPVSLARRAITNQAIDIQSGVQVGNVKIGTTALIEGLEVSRNDRNYLLSLYGRELKGIHESATSTIYALDLDNSTGKISRQEYITERVAAQEKFAESLSKLQGDVAEVVEAVGVEVGRNRLKFSQKDRKVEYSAEGKGSQYEAGNYVKTIDKCWKAAREAETHDIPQWVRSVAGY